MAPASAKTMVSALSQTTRDRNKITESDLKKGEKFEMRK